MKTLFLVAGRTASGKSTIVNEACKDLGLKRVKSYTTRPPRKEEMENPEESDHYFLQDEDVAKYKNDIAAYTEINGYKYFTTRDILNKSDIYVIDPNGIDTLKKMCKGEFCFVVIYIVRDKDNMKAGFCERGEDEEVFEKRYQAEDEQFSNFEKNMDWDYYVLNNGDIKDSIKTFEFIIEDC